jgi:hypothetical protein
MLVQAPGEGPESLYGSSTELRAVTRALPALKIQSELGWIARMFIAKHPMIVIGQRVATHFLDPTSRWERKPLATAVG